VEPGLNQKQQPRLVGWKRIAAHLGCSERTARRWEHEEALPVLRQVHESRSTVYALPSDLDAWIAVRTAPDGTSKTATRPALPRLRPLFLPVLPVSAGVCVLGLLVWTMFLQPTDRGDGQGAQHLATVSTSPDPVALDLYKSGRALWLQRGKAPNARAIKLLRETVKRDGHFAAAWAALASAWITYPTYNADIPLETAIEEAVLAADRALELDPSLAEPRSVMASIAQRRGDWLRSEVIYGDALKADPGNTMLMLWFAGHHRDLGHVNAAEALIQQAMDMDPNSPPILTEMAMTHIHLGRFDAGGALIDYLWDDIGLQTPIVWMGRWMMMIARKDLEAADRWMQYTPYQPFKSVFQAYTDHMRGRKDGAADPFADSVKTAYQAGLPAWLAFYMLDQSGLPDAALDILDAATADGSFDTSVVLFYTGGADSRASAYKTLRFAELVSRLGFVAYWRKHGPPDMCADAPGLPVCRAVSGPL